MGLYELLLEGPLLIAIISMIGLIVTLIFNIRSSRENTKTRLTGLMNQLIHEHYTLYTKEPKLKERNEVLAHAQAYFDLMNRIAYLSIKGQIPKQVPTYLRSYYGYVQQWIYYYNHVLVPEFNISGPAHEDWPYIEKWCRDLGIWDPKGELTVCNFLNVDMDKWRIETIKKEGIQPKRSK